MPTKKRKPMTAKEKRMRKEVREEMRADGLLPPCKKPLNRRKFATDIISQYREKSTYGFHLEFIPQAIACMLPYEGERRISAEQVGVLKVLKIALDISQFHEGMKLDGKTSYTAGELVDVINPTLIL